VGTALAPPFAVSVWSSRDFDPIILNSPSPTSTRWARAQVVAVVTAPFKTNTLARGLGESAEHMRRDRLAP
jgi:hypothetical protein